ncbi:hypothetical protein SAMN02745174_00146 [Cetobacterium ceti]|uniref:DUF2147 domain-containing protein n=1 Tax=Cetobacterium ceti TaxID=180163 RepID=A0A1T4JWS7_9FUSO|nr:DUF2147 domain-containing protein [Cetobacterium ceti]SJZ34656.1 hypothetical protein SAMN02745174_00146 [Cetobacterium ceti]
MKKFILFLFILINTFIFSATNDAWLQGKWITEKAENGNQIVVEFYKKNEKYFGKIIQLTIPKYNKNEKYSGMEKMDLHNPKENLRNRKLKGLDFVSNFTLENNKLVDGNIYNPENGKTYHCKITKKSDNTLLVKGSIDSMGLIGKSQIWTKIN